MFKVSAKLRIKALMLLKGLIMLFFFTFQHVMRLTFARQQTAPVTLPTICLSRELSQHLSLPLWKVTQRMSAIL